MENTVIKTPEIKQSTPVPLSAQLIKPRWTESGLNTNK